MEEGQKNKQTGSRPVTRKELGSELGKFAETVIFPGVERIIDERLVKIDHRMGGIEQRVGGIEHRMGGVEQRVGGIEQKLETFKDEIVDEVSRKIIQSNDKVVTKLDTWLKEQAAHTMSHRRVDDTLHSHDKRIKKLEAPHLR